MEEETNKANVMLDLKKETEKSIEEIKKQGIDSDNIKYLYQLVDIHKDIENEEYWKIKEENYMRYNGYDNYNGYGRNSYGRMRDSRGRYMDSGNYGTKGYDTKYRGEKLLDNMYQNYQDYSEGREMYGADSNTIKSLEYMLKLDKKFIEMLEEEAQSPEEMELIRAHKMEMAQM